MGIQGFKGLGFRLLDSHPTLDFAVLGRRSLLDPHATLCQSSTVSWFRFRLGAVFGFRIGPGVQGFRGLGFFWRRLPTHRPWIRILLPNPRDFEPEVYIKVYLTLA